MAEAKIVIVQAGTAGAPGRARDDLVLSQVVTLQNDDDTGVVSWRWSLTRPKGSTATLSNPTAAQPAFTPDVLGSYMVELQVNGAASGEVVRTVAAMRNATLVVNGNSHVTRFIGIGEGEEADWNVDLGGGLAPNTTGWWEDMDRWFRMIYDLAVSPPGMQDLASVLTFGTITDGNDIEVSDGDSIVPVTDGNPSIGSSSLGFGALWLSDGAAQAVSLAGAGDPEGAVTAPVGSTWQRTDGAAGTSLYVKESGVGNTGWSAVETTGSTDPLATVLGAGNTTGGNDIVVSDGDDIVPATDGNPSLGGAALRWAAVFSTALYLAGAAPADADANAADLVMGAGAGDAGATFNVGNAGGTGKLAWNDGSDSDDGLIQYTPNANLMEFGVNGSAELRLNASVLGPSSVAGGLDLGTSGVPFGVAYTQELHSGVAYLAGASSGDAPAGADELVIGDGSAADFGITIFTGTANSGGLCVTDVLGNERSSLTYRNNSGDWVFRLEGANRYNMAATVFYPNTTGAADLGQAANRWGAGFIDTVYVASAVSGQANVVADDLVIGNTATASAHGISILGANNQDKYIFFGSAADNDAGGLTYDDSADLFRFRAGGTDQMYVDPTELAPSSAGLINLGSATRPWGDAHAGVLYLAGAASGDADADADDLVISDGSANGGATVMVASGSTTGRYGFTLTTATGAFRAGMHYQPSGGERLELYLANAAHLALSTSSLYPSTTGAKDIGRDTHRWGAGFINQLNLGGAVAADGVSGADALVIGDGSGATGITGFMGSGNTFDIVAAEVSGTLRGRIRYAGGSESWFVGTAGVDRYILAGASLYCADGVQGLGLSASNGWTSLVLTERADHVGVATATRAEMWLRSGTHQDLMLTDDEGNDHVLNRWEVHLPAQTSEEPSSSAATLNSGMSGLGDRSYLDFDDGANSDRLWQLRIPRGYAGGDITVRIYYFGAASNAGANDVVFFGAFERFVAGAAMGTAGFASAQSVTTTPDATAQNLVVADITFTNAEIDGAQAGEWVAFRLSRTPGVGADDYTSPARVFGCLLTESV